MWGRTITFGDVLLQRQIVNPGEEIFATPAWLC
jgi:hypothetical protein